MRRTLRTEGLDLRPRASCHRAVDALLSHLLSSDPAVVETELGLWWIAVAPLRRRFEHTVERALALGLVAPTVGCAFVGGYQSALHAMVPSLGPDARAALCATEEGGAHPRAIATRVTAAGEGVTLEGAKRFVTGARHATTLLVLASEGTHEDGRNRLALVRVPADAASVRFEDMPATAFAPDVPHASVTFASVPLTREARLPGDGWSDYVKPFRTVEDLHVQAAVTAWLLGALRRHEGPSALIERLAAHALSLRALADAAVGAPATHLALAGAFANLEAITEAMEAWWPSAPDALRAQWARDRTLLKVASNAREQRRLRAWATLAERVVEEAE